MTRYPEAVQLASEVRDVRVREAFARVDRRRFVPQGYQSSAWADHPLPLSATATLSQPSLVAQMTEWLELDPTHRVLEIGTGSGYHSAILAELADAVYTIEYDAALARAAQQRLRALGYRNIQFQTGDGAEGWPQAAPFDRIIASVAFPKRPTRLLEQLCLEGLALIPVGPADRLQRLLRYQRLQQGVESRELTGVVFVSLQSP